MLKQEFEKMRQARIETAMVLRERLNKKEYEDTDDPYMDFVVFNLKKRG